MQRLAQQEKRVIRQLETAESAIQEIVGKEQKAQ